MTVLAAIGDIYSDVVGEDTEVLESGDGLYRFLMEEIGDVTGGCPATNYDAWCEAVRALEVAVDQVEQVLEKARVQAAAAEMLQGVEVPGASQDDPARLTP